MYYIMDLIENKFYGFDTKQQLLYRWRQMTSNPSYFRARNLKLSFEQLNVTGVDTTSRLEEIPGKYFTTRFGIHPCHEWVQRLRRYQVVDDAGRSIDIRAWKEELRQVEGTDKNLWNTPNRPVNAPKFRQGPCGQGRKNRNHFIAGPAMWKASMSAQSMDEPLDEDAGLRPILDHTKVRTRGINEYTNAYRSQYKISGRWGGSKSWKDQSKAGRQWARHKPSCSKKSLREAARLELSLAKLMAQEESVEEMLDAFFAFDGSDDETHGGAVMDFPDFMQAFLAAGY